MQHPILSKPASRTEVRLAVHEEIFRRFPGYVRGVVVASGVDNGPSCSRLGALLRAEEETLRRRPDIESPAQWPEIAVWREAYRSLGAKPGRFRCSLEALVRRVLKGHSVPSIHRLVDLANLISLRHLVPAGGHALEEVTGDLELRVAQGGESFLPLGSEDKEILSPGEVIFAEGDRVLTRRWTWRQGQHTVVESASRQVEFNIDGLPPISVDRVQRAGDDLIDLLARFCGGRFRFRILTAERPEFDLVSLGEA